MNQKEKKILLLMITIVILVISSAAYRSCTTRADRQEADIESCEARLDSIANHTTFMDTIGETDVYSYLCDAKKKFDHAITSEDRNRAYREYKYWYDKCIEMHVDLSVQEIKDSLLN